MPAEAVDVAITKTRARRSPSAHVQQARVKERVYLSLDIDAAQRLGLHALMTRRDKGDIVSELVRTHLRQWHARRGHVGEPGDAESVAVA
ncbi:MAG: hypothetical protein AB7W06_17345 [Alphaproteobacteria bacterium]